MSLAVRPIAVGVTSSADRRPLRATISAQLLELRRVEAVATLVLRPRLRRRDRRERGDEACDECCDKRLHVDPPWIACDVPSPCALLEPVRTGPQAHPIGGIVPLWWLRLQLRFGRARVEGSADLLRPAEL